ncbi:MAG: LON peptidase substrate-binding domain-containing protein, partial [Planctomycetota bacterium]
MSDDQLPGFNEPMGLIPLPNVVLFPGATLPLHIFEPRYRIMVNDALQTEAMIAMALLHPGYEASYYTNYAKIHPVVGAGQIQEHIQVADGRYFIRIQGICRARVLQEYHDAEYRMALLEPLPQEVSGIDTDGEFAARQ